MMTTLRTQMDQLQARIVEAEENLDTATNIKKTQQAEKKLKRLYYKEDALNSEIELFGIDSWYCCHCEKWFSIEIESPIDGYCEDCDYELFKSDIHA